MRLKKSKQNKSMRIGARVSDAEFNKIKTMANLYTDGNLSEWVSRAALNYKPKKDQMEK